ncbi:hypothetical protein [Sphingorhabdus wooponensis]|jgi:hypothetical protein|uniref:Uncharacterized protein n=1 Tax=Sphingorhabdus wooponensis TaxID=940136 RepID=A0A3R8R5J4_9SPHN|nr:hypothetical protein [Sphingorhabdus wooponensis]RRQ52418.1 hypothetical protein D7D48_06120 [Sphingorhabdus wooponensis]
MIKLTYAIMLAAIYVPSVYAAEKENVHPKVYTDIMACRSVTDAAARLQCFDIATRALETATSKRQIVMLDQGDVRKTKKSLFGFALPNIAFFGESSEDQANEFKEIEGELANVQALPYGIYQFTAVDAGTWQTTEASSAFLKNGKKFKIKRAALNSYLLVIDNKGIRVKRVS